MKKMEFDELVDVCRRIGDELNTFVDARVHYERSLGWVSFMHDRHDGVYLDLRYNFKTGALENAEDGRPVSGIVALADLVRKEKGKLKDSRNMRSYVQIEEEYY